MALVVLEERVGPVGEQQLHDVRVSAQRLPVCEQQLHDARLSAQRLPVGEQQLHDARVSAQGLPVGEQQLHDVRVSAQGLADDARAVVGLVLHVLAVLVQQRLHLVLAVVTKQKTKAPKRS